MASRSRNSITTVMLAIVLPATAPAQTLQQPVTMNLCEVVTSPDAYNGRALTVAGILVSSEHSLALYSPQCKPKYGFDVTVEAVLPTAWESLTNGKQLRKLLRRGKEARVSLTGTFESGTSRFGPDAARFRFAVTEIPSAEKR
jgi:hypothetical protein